MVHYMFNVSPMEVYPPVCSL